MHCLFCFLLIILSFVATPSQAVETGTSTIHYYFGLETSRGGSSGPVTPTQCSNSCSGATPDQRAYPNCECYCGKNCNAGYVLDINSCSCVISCSDGVDNDGNCCPSPGYNANNCLTKQTYSNGCEIYVSACDLPRICDGAGSCVCPETKPIWTGSDCVECVTNSDCLSGKPLCENNVCVNKCDDVVLTDSECQMCDPFTGNIAHLTDVSCSGGICSDGKCVVVGGSDCDAGYKWDSSLAKCVCDGANTPECCEESGGSWINGRCETYCYSEQIECEQKGQYADINDNCACKCPEGTEFNGSECEDICQGAQIYKDGECVCDNGLSADDCDSETETWDSVNCYCAPKSECSDGAIYCSQGFCCGNVCCPEGYNCDDASSVCCQGPIADKSSAS